MDTWGIHQLIKDDVGTIIGLDLMGWTIPVFKVLNSHHWEKGVHEEILEYDEIHVESVAVRDSRGMEVFWYDIIPKINGIEETFNWLNKSLYDRDIIINTLKDIIWTETFYTFYFEDP